MRIVLLIKFITFFMFATILSCSSPVSTNRYPLNAKEYRNHKVSVQSAVDLAVSSYIKGCSDKAKSKQENNFFSRCVEEANKYIKENVIEILDQNPTILK